MMISTKFDFGDIVYLVTDEEQQGRMVTGIVIYPGNIILYTLSCGQVNSNHYEFEIIAEKNILLK